MKSYYIVFYFFSLLIYSGTSLQAQCFEDVEYEANTKEGVGSISLGFSESYSDVKITLYDFYAIDAEMQIGSKVLDFELSSYKVIVFEDLKLSSYLLKLEYDGCIQYVGGIDGINFNDK